MSPEVERVLRVVCNSVGCGAVFETSEPRSRGAATSGVLRLLPLLKNRGWGIITVHRPTGSWAATVQQGANENELHVLCPEHFDAVRLALGQPRQKAKPVAAKVKPDGVAEAPPLSWKDGDT